MPQLKDLDKRKVYPCNTELHLVMYIYISLFTFRYHIHIMQLLLYMASLLIKKYKTCKTWSLLRNLLHYLSCKNTAG